MKETSSTSKKEVPKHRNALQDKYQKAKDLGQDNEPLNPDNIQKQKNSCPNLVAGDYLCYHLHQRKKQRVVF